LCKLFNLPSWESAGFEKKQGRTLGAFELLTNDMETVSYQNDSDGEDYASGEEDEGSDEDEDELDDLESSHDQTGKHAAFTWLRFRII